jgi:hypothetical protein
MKTTSDAFFVFGFALLLREKNLQFVEFLLVLFAETILNCLTMTFEHAFTIVHQNTQHIIRSTMPLIFKKGCLLLFLVLKGGSILKRGLLLP